jgi:hypothetical protein
MYKLGLVRRLDYIGGLTGSLSETIEARVVFLLHFRRIYLAPRWLVVVLLEVPGIGGRGNMWPNGCFQLTIVHLGPVDIFEERMCFDISSTTALISKTLLRRDLTKLGNDVFSICRHPRRVLDFPFDDPSRHLVRMKFRRMMNDNHILLIDLHGILIPKWWLPYKELVYEYTECPPVNGAAVAGILDCFRRKIFLKYLAAERDPVAETHTGVPQRVNV